MPPEQVQPEKKPRMNFGSAFDSALPVLPPSRQSTTSPETPATNLAQPSEIIAPPIVPSRGAPLERPTPVTPQELRMIPTQNVASASFENLEKEVRQRLEGGYSAKLQTQLDDQLRDIESSIKATEARVANDKGWGLAAWGRWLTGSDKADVEVLKIEQAALQALQTQKNALSAEIQNAEMSARTLLLQASQANEQSSLNSGQLGRKHSQRAALLMERAHEALLAPEQYISKLSKEVAASREGQIKVAREEARKESPTSVRNLCIMGAAIFVTVATFGAAPGVGLFGAALYAAWCGTLAGTAVGSIFNAGEQGISLLSGEKTASQAAWDFGKQLLKDFSFSVQNSSMVAGGFVTGGIVGRVLGVGAKLLPNFAARALTKFTPSITAAVSANVNMTAEHVFATKVLGIQREGYALDFAKNGVFAAIAAPLARFLPPAMAKSVGDKIARVAFHVGADGALAVAQNAVDGQEMSVENLTETAKLLLTNQAAGLGGRLQYQRARFPVEAYAEERAQLANKHSFTNRYRNVASEPSAKEIFDAQRCLGLKPGEFQKHDQMKARACTNYDQLRSKAAAIPDGATRDKRFSELDSALRAVYPDAPVFKLRALQLLGLDPNTVYDGRSGYETAVIKAYEAKRSQVRRGHGEQFDKRMADLDKRMKVEVERDFQASWAEFQKKATLAKRTDADLELAHRAYEEKYRVATKQKAATEAERDEAIRFFGMDPAVAKQDPNLATKLKSAAEGLTLEALKHRRDARNDLGIDDSKLDDSAVQQAVDALAATKRGDLRFDAEQTIAKRFLPELLKLGNESKIELTRDLNSFHNETFVELLKRPMPEGVPPYIRLGLVEFKSDVGKVVEQWDKADRRLMRLLRTPNLNLPPDSPVWRAVDLVPGLRASWSGGSI